MGYTLCRLLYDGGGLSPITKWASRLQRIAMVCLLRHSSLVQQWYWPVGLPSLPAVGPCQFSCHVKCISGGINVTQLRSLICLLPSLYRRGERVYPPHSSSLQWWNFLSNSSTQHMGDSPQCRPVLSILVFNAALWMLWPRDHCHYDTGVWIRSRGMR